MKQTPTTPKIIDFIVSAGRPVYMHELLEKGFGWNHKRLLRDFILNLVNDGILAIDWTEYGDPVYSIPAIDYSKEPLQNAAQPVELPTPLTAPPVSSLSDLPDNHAILLQAYNKGTWRDYTGEDWNQVREDLHQMGLLGLHHQSLQPFYHVTPQALMLLSPARNSVAATIFTLAKLSNKTTYPTHRSPDMQDHHRYASVLTLCTEAIKGALDVLAIYGGMPRETESDHHAAMMGMLLGRIFDYSGMDVLKVSADALSDCNWHTESAVLQDIIEKQERFYMDSALETETTAAAPDDSEEDGEVCPLCKHATLFQNVCENCLYDTHRGITEENWKVYRHDLDRLSEEEAKALCKCQTCGCDVRFGRHNLQTAVDDYTCKPYAETI